MAHDTEERIFRDAAEFFNSEIAPGINEYCGTAPNKNRAIGAVLLSATMDRLYKCDPEMADPIINLCREQSRNAIRRIRQ